MAWCALGCPGLLMGRFCSFSLPFSSSSSSSPKSYLPWNSAMWFHRGIYHVNPKGGTIGQMTAGASFGESVLSDAPRRSTIVTRENCELLRVEQRDFRHIWQAIVLCETRVESSSVHRCGGLTWRFIAEGRCTGGPLKAAVPRLRHSDQENNIP
ncbi:hypothetical protein O3P69_005237 [Scylla paramamosain]|uniref:Cyclic nucleotide-binding domain-containing protein n=1 Tax=Scylla paramamosain TaxID=85552 RepID=A0AAW0U7E3_SCYPA